jgi:drug/metabolite transporter (DMT)-like permease
MVLSRVIGLVFLPLLIAALPTSTFCFADLAWGAAAGLVGGSGLALLYAGLATGRMSSVAPITAIVAALVPVATGLALGERPSGWALAGVTLAIIGIGLLSLASNDVASSSVLLTPPRKVAPSGIQLAVVAGIAIGLFYIFISRASAEAGLWPLITSMGAGLCLFLGFAGVSPRRLWPHSSVLRLALGSACFDLIGTALFLYAAYRGPLSLVSVLTSLYPGTTVLLAVWLLGERMTKARIAGLVSTGVGICLIVGG